MATFKHVNSLKGNLYTDNVFPLFDKNKATSLLG